MNYKIIYRPERGWSGEIFPAMFDNEVRKYHDFRK